MADRGSPDWYFQASNELLLNKDTEDTRALLEEARADLRAGHEPKALVATLKAKGARNNAQGVVNRAVKLELPSIAKSASDDLGAGRSDSPALARMRTLATGILLENPSGQDFSARMKEAGVSDALIAHFAADPALRKQGQQQAWIYLGLGIVAAVGAAWYYTSTPPGDLPYSAGAFAAVAFVLLSFGIRGLNRK